MPNYSKAYLNKMVEEFTAEFDALVSSEVKKSEKTSGNSLKKSEDGDSDKEKSSEGSSGGESDGDSSSEPSGGSDGPPSDGDNGASAGGPPADPASAAAGPAGGAPDPASASGVSPADPAAGASGGDPVQALVQAYSQLSPEEIQAHFFAMKQVLQAQTGAGADPMAAAGAGAPPPAPAGGADPTMAAPGPDAAAPMAGEGSKPVDPAASMALKSEYEKQLNLIKKERDAALAKSQQLEKSLSGLTDQLEKLVVKPERKAVTGKDLLKSEPQTQTVTMTREQIIKKLTVVARNPDLKKSDRDAITKYTVGGVSADSIAHLLS